jgi:alpha-L-fucosidase
LIPQASQDNLRAVGRWLKVNGESIYGAGATPFGGELGAVDTTRMDKIGKPAFKMATEWRCTTKPGKLYIHLFQYPRGEFTLAGAGKVTKAYMLADAKRTALKVAQAGAEATVTLPAAAADAVDSVLVLERAK